MRSWTDFFHNKPKAKLFSYDQEMNMIVEENVDPTNRQVQTSEQNTEEMLQIHLQEDKKS